MWYIQKFSGSRPNFKYATPSTLGFILASFVNGVSFSDAWKLGYNEGNESNLSTNAIHPQLVLQMLFVPTSSWTVAEQVLAA